MPYALPANPKRSDPDANIFRNAVAITPADGAPIGPFQRFYTGAGGNITVCPENSATPVLFASTPAGTIIPVAIQGVEATGTVATGILGIY